MEVRLAGRELRGLLVPFDREGRYDGGRELFVAGAFGPAPSIESVNLQHIAGAIIATAPKLEVRADGIHLAAELVAEPIGDVAASLVRRGTASGLSVEFQCVREDRGGGSPDRRSSPLWRGAGGSSCISRRRRGAAVCTGRRSSPRHLEGAGVRWPWGYRVAGGR